MPLAAVSNQFDRTLKGAIDHGKPHEQLQEQHPECRKQASQSVHEPEQLQQSFLQQHPVLERAQASQPVHRRGRRRERQKLLSQFLQELPLTFSSFGQRLCDSTKSPLFAARFFCAKSSGFSCAIFNFVQYNSFSPVCTAPVCSRVFQNRKTSRKIA
jgi:hypothetical protein